MLFLYDFEFKMSLILKFECRLLQNTIHIMIFFFTHELLIVLKFTHCTCGLNHSWHFTVIVNLISIIFFVNRKFLKLELCPNLVMFITILLVICMVLACQCPGSTPRNFDLKPKMTKTEKEEKYEWKFQRHSLAI